VDEHSYFVRCVLADPKRVPDLECGQLVAVRGRGNGAPADRPEIAACSVYWTGDRPSAPAADASTKAFIAGRSVSLCWAQAERMVVLQELAAARARGEAALPGTRTAVLEVVLEDVSRSEARCLADITTARAQPLACFHPVLALVQQCRNDVLGSVLGVLERNYEKAGPPHQAPECMVPMVQDALRNLVVGEEAD